MRELFDRLLADKARARVAVAALPVAQKLRILEAMRDETARIRPSRVAEPSPAVTRNGDRAASRTSND